tara:strand:+ start:75 stop:488 length:414 start_codon:yes stop_codon:yes gene_type:complete
METLTKITPQQRSIANYRKVGIEIRKEDEVVIISQKKIYNGFILNQKQLIERAKKIFPDQKIRPAVFSLDVSEITLEWIDDKMKEFGIKRKDLIKQLAIDKTSLSVIFSGKVELSKRTKASFYYYFLTYELNRDLRS